MRQKILYLFAILGLATFYLYTEEVVVLFLALFLSIGAIFSLITLKFTAKKLSTEIKASQSLFKNEQGKVHLKIDNDSIFMMPFLRLTIIVRNKLSDETFHEHIQVSVGGKEKLLLPLDFSSKQMGYFMIEIKEIYMKDFLNCFNSIQKPKGLWTNTFVYSHSMPIQLILNRDPVLSFMQDTLQYKTRKQENSQQIVGIKPYDIQDNIKQIHWKLSAKLDELMVKEMSQSQNEQIILLYDSYQSGGPSEKIAKAEAFIALSYAMLQNEQAHSLGWYDQANQQMKTISIQTRADWTKMQKDLLLLEHQSSFSSRELIKEMQQRYNRMILFTVDDELNYSQMLELYNVTAFIATNDLALKDNQSTKAQITYFSLQTIESRLQNVLI